MKNKKVVTMGGGTGTFPVITALRQLPVKVSTVVAVSDSGGSTGRIRDEFGFPPVGDLRQSLAALSDPASQEWIRKILLYRFEKGTGLTGHSLGNLILTALQDMTGGNTTAALEIAEAVFDLEGSVIPVTAENVDLKIHYTDGSSQIGEHILDEKEVEPKIISRVELVPKCTLNPAAETAILEADFIIIGPGDYYASLMATLVVDGIKAVFKKSKAKVIYISNLMTRRTQTHGMTTADLLDGIERVIGKKVDYVLINNEKIPAAIVKAYAAEEEFQVDNNLEKDPRVIAAPLIRTTVVQKAASDSAYRSLLRHDENKLYETLKEII